MALLVKHQGDRGIQEVRGQLDFIEVAARSVVLSLEEIKRRSSEGILRAGSASAVADSMPAESRNSADRLLDMYEGTSIASMTPSWAGESELAAMHRYLVELSNRMSRYVVEEGRATVTVDGAQSASIARLAVVMRLLLCPDVQWSECDVEALPIWLLETDQAATLRDFCIDHGRPRAAFEFAMRSRHVRTPPLSNRDFVDFVLEQAQSRLDRPAVAMALLQAAITDMSRGQNPVVEDIPLRLFICQLRTKSGQYLVAAGEAHVAWERAKAAGSSWAGKAAVAELVSLYRAEQYESVIALSKDYRGEDACREYLPEILFLMWSAAREKNIPDDTKEAEQTLLDKFPNHPVLVDVYLVKALRLGIGGDVREAIRQLLLVESQFPDSAGAAKAASIRNGLEKRASGLRNP